MSTEAPPAYKPVPQSEGEAAAQPPPPQYNANAPAVASNVSPVPPPQYGQPIQPSNQPSANVQYVNQYGQPIAAPTSAITTTTVTPQSNVQFVNQYGQPIAAPTGTAVTTVTTSTTTPPTVTTTNVNDTGKAANAQERNKRIIAFCIGGLGALLLFIGR